MKHITLKTEEKLYQLVSSIQGVGEAQVWVTLESGVEYVYLQEEVRNTDTTKDYDEEGVKTLREKEKKDLPGSGKILFETYR